ncbi:MAG: insulinase family protein, partial [Gammaproteobacteria bacterium]|nr:insulinase family protein [Gammaproteobacteria bacterium]
EAELQRVKAQVMASSVYEQDSVFYQAMQMGILETIGVGWQRKQEYLDGIKSVTAEQVQAVAKKYLNRDQLTVAVLEPLPVDGRALKKSTGAMRHGR